MIQLFLGILVGYLILLTAAAWMAKKYASYPPERFPRILVLIPAHNEERLLGSSLKSLAEVDYPAEQWSVFVVADNCTDQTAEIARQGGAVVCERKDETRRGKGPALQWLLHQIRQAAVPHDGIVVIDADTVVSRNFLQVMASRFQNGEQVIQAYYTVRDPERSWSAGLRYAALTVLHYLRPQGRMALGASAGLKGNGMFFSAELMQRYAWSAEITEDIDFHMQLLLAGERVTFAPDAVAAAEMPHSLVQSESQHLRWEQGRLLMAARYLPRLFWAALEALRKGDGRRAYVFLDAAFEHIIPPFAVLLGAALILFLADLGLFILSRATFFPFNAPILEVDPGISTLNLLFGMGLVGGQILYLISGLYLARAPRQVYRTLIYAPLYMVWKIGQYLSALSKRKQVEWVRTRRNEG